jgi:Zn-dependent M28 family amino/carboxypeptidase
METPSIDVGLAMLGQVNRDRALTDLRKLTGEEAVCEEGGCYTITNRQTGSEGLQWAKKYVIGELTKAGYSVQLEAWSHGGYSDQNLIARKPGAVRPEEEVYFVAHLDGVKNLWGERYPAADDDASGVVDLLELARTMGSQSFNRTAVLFFSTGEEQDSLGVKSHLSQLSPEGLRAIKDVVDIDMIGYDADQDGVMQLFHGDQPTAKALTTAMKATILEYGIDLTPMVLKGCP